MAHRTKARKETASWAADLEGDYRDEVVCIGPDESGKQAVMVYMNTTPATGRGIARTADREYALWLARNIGGGYASYFEWQGRTSQPLGMQRSGPATAR